MSRVQAQVRLSGSLSDGRWVFAAWPVWPGYGKVRDVPPEVLLPMTQHFRRRYPDVQQVHKKIIRWREDA